MGTNPFAAETLIQHADWVRGLVRTMVHDEHLAEDLAQDALEAGLRGDPAAVENPRAWLRGVARNLNRQRVRGDARRSTRERRRGPQDTAPATADLVARVETQELVARAVLRLPDPTRKVLLLRFYEGLSVRRIAAMEDLSVERVKYQVRRGLRLLRDDLRRQLGPNWAALVLPLGIPALGLPSLPLAVVAWTTMNQKLALSLAVVALAWIAAAAWPEGEPSTAAQADAVTAGLEDALDPRLATPSAGEVLRESAAPSPGTGIPDASAPASGGSIVDARGAPLAIDGELSSPKLLDAGIAVVGGHFELPSGWGPETLRSPNPGDFLLTGTGAGPARPSMAQWVAREGDTALLQLRLEDPIRYEVLVEDHYGQPIPDARIRVASPTFISGAPVLQTDADGRAFVEVRNAAGGARLRVDAAGFAESYHLLAAAQSESPVRLRLGRLYALGLVVDHRYRTLLSWAIGPGEKGLSEDAQVPVEERRLLEQAELAARLQPYESVTWLVQAESGPHSVPAQVKVGFILLGKEVHDPKLPMQPLDSPQLTVHRVPQELREGLPTLKPCVLTLGPTTAFAATAPETVQAVFALQDGDAETWTGITYGPGTEGADGPVYILATGRRATGRSYRFWLPGGTLSPLSERPRSLASRKPIFLPGQSFQVGPEGGVADLVLHPDERWVEIALVDPNGFAVDLPAQVLADNDRMNMDFGLRQRWPMRAWLRMNEYTVSLRSAGREHRIGGGRFPAPLDDNGRWNIEVDLESAGVAPLKTY